MEGENRLTLGERLSQRSGRIFKRAERRPRIGLAPEFYARLGLDDPWLSPQAASEASDQGDGFVYLSAIPYYNLMRRLARARKRREAQFERFFERRAGTHTQVMKRRWPGEARAPITQFARSVVDEMVLPPPAPVVAPPEVVASEEPGVERVRPRSRRSVLANTVVALPSTARVFRGGVEAGDERPASLPPQLGFVAQVSRDLDRRLAAAPEAQERKSRPIDRVGDRLHRASSLTGASFQAWEQSNPVMAASASRRMTRVGRPAPVLEFLDEPGLETAPAVRRVLRSVRRAGPLGREVLETVAPELRAAGWAEGRARSERKTGLRPMLSRSPLMSALVPVAEPAAVLDADGALVAGPSRPATARSRPARAVVVPAARGVEPTRSALLPAPVAYARAERGAAGRVVVPAAGGARIAAVSAPIERSAFAPKRLDPPHAITAASGDAGQRSPAPVRSVEASEFEDERAPEPRRMRRSRASARAVERLLAPPVVWAETDSAPSAVPARVRRVITQVGPALVSQRVMDDTSASPVERPAFHAYRRLDAQARTGSLVPRPAPRAPEAVPIQFAPVGSEDPAEVASAVLAPRPSTSRAARRASVDSAVLPSATAAARPTDAAASVGKVRVASPETTVVPSRSGVGAADGAPLRAAAVLGTSTRDTADELTSAPRPAIALRRERGMRHAATRAEQPASTSPTAQLLLPGARSSALRTLGVSSRDTASPGQPLPLGGDDGVVTRPARQVATPVERTRALSTSIEKTLLVPGRESASSTEEFAGPQERERVIPVTRATPDVGRADATRGAPASRPETRAAVEPRRARFEDLGWGDTPAPHERAAMPLERAPARAPARVASRPVAHTGWNHLLQTLERALGALEKSSIVPAPTARGRMAGLETSFLAPTLEPAAADGSVASPRRRAVRVLRATVAAASRGGDAGPANIAGFRAVAALQSVVQRMAALGGPSPDARVRPMAFARALDTTYVTPMGVVPAESSANPGSTPVVNAAGQWMSARSAAESGTAVGYTTSTAPRPSRRNVVRAPDAAPLPLTRAARTRVPATTWVYARGVPGDVPDQVAVAETGLSPERPVRSGAVRSSRARPAGLVLAAPTEAADRVEEQDSPTWTSTPSRRPRRSLGGTLRGVASGDVEQGAPGWASRSDKRTTGVATVDGLFSALARATSAEEVVRVIVERAATSDAATIAHSGPMAEVIREIQREVVTQTLEAPEEVTRPIRAEAISNTVRRPTYVEPVPSSARTFGGGGGRSRASAVRVNASGGDTRITRLVKKLQGLIHLAEAERRLDAAKGQVRMAEDTPGARAEASAPMGPGHQSRRDLERLDVNALVSEVVSQVNDILGSQRERRMEDSDESVWW